MSDSCQTNKEPLPFKERFKTWDFWKPLLYTAIGGIGEFLYYYYVGCASGTCAITSNPYSVLIFKYLSGSRPYPLIRMLSDVNVTTAKALISVSTIPLKFTIWMPCFI